MYSLESDTHFSSVSIVTKIGKKNVKLNWRMITENDGLSFVGTYIYIMLMR